MPHTRFRYRAFPVLAVLALLGLGCGKRADETSQQPAAAQPSASSVKTVCPITLDLVDRFCNLPDGYVLNPGSPDYPCAIEVPDPQGNLFVFDARDVPLRSVQDEFDTTSMYEYLEREAAKIAADAPLCFRPAVFRLDGPGRDAAVADRGIEEPNPGCADCRCVYTAPARATTEFERERGYQLAVAYRDRVLRLSGLDGDTGCSLTEAEALARHLIGETPRVVARETERSPSQPSTASPDSQSPSQVPTGAGDDCPITPAIVKGACRLPGEVTPNAYGSRCTFDYRAKNYPRSPIILASISQRPGITLSMIVEEMRQQFDQLAETNPGVMTRCRVIETRAIAGLGDEALFVPGTLFGCGNGVLPIEQLERAPTLYIRRGARVAYIHSYQGDTGGYDGCAPEEILQIGREYALPRL